MNDYPQFPNGLLEAERAGAKLLEAMHESHLAGTPAQLASSNAA